MKKIVKLINNERSNMRLSSHKGCDFTAYDKCNVIDNASCTVYAYDYCSKKDYAGCAEGAHDECVIDTHACIGPNSNDTY